MVSDWAKSVTQDEHGGCSVCGRTDVTLKKDGTLRMHVRADAKGNSHAMSWTSLGPRCSGSGKPPKSVEEVPDAG